MVLSFDTELLEGRDSVSFIFVLLRPSLVPNTVGTLIEYMHE
jgi:hypothetical protein